MDKNKLPEYSSDDRQIELAPIIKDNPPDYLTSEHNIDISQDYDQGDMETHVGSDHEHDEMHSLSDNQGEPETFDAIAMEHTQVPDEPPPPYDDYNPHTGYGHLDNSSINVESEHTARETSAINSAQENNFIDDKEEFEFPESNLFELEGRCFVDSWSIPYKKSESLGILLQASAKLAAQGKADEIELCKRFMDRAMPDCFSKLTTSGAVQRWDNNIQEGIFDMLTLFTDLVANKLRTSHISKNTKVLQLLSDVFKPDNPYNQKNRHQRFNKTRWEIELKGQLFATSPHFTLKKDPCGWLVDLMNYFGFRSGFTAMQNLTENPSSLQLEELYALLHPLANPIDYFDTNFFKENFKDSMTKIISYLKDLKDDDLKRKEISCFSDCINDMKIIVHKFWSPNDISNIDDIRLEITLKMIKHPHFNAKMNGLIEVLKLIDESQGSFSSMSYLHIKSPISNHRLLEWLTSNSILSIALEGNLHHSQYCDKLKKIIEFLGTRLTNDEITKIWNRQADQNQTLIDNIHTLISSATSKLNSVQMDHLFSLIQKSWESEPDDRNQERLLKLIGKIAKDDKLGKVANKVLELLWDLAHSPTLSNEMLEEALEAHSTILSDSYFIKETTRKSYIQKCLDDIKKLSWLTPALQQLYKIVKGYVKRSTLRQPRTVLTDLQKTYELIRVACNSLTNYHKAIVKKIGKEKLSGDTLIENNRYKHSECIEAHLKILHYILTDGALYLPKIRAEEVWDALANSDSSLADRELCYEWFHNAICDLESDTQTYMFQSKVLKIHPRTLTMNGYRCLRVFFEYANQNERRLKRSGGTTIIDRFDLIGLDYMWQAALEVQGHDIAELLINNILQVSYQHLSPKLKKDVAQIHKTFINECTSKLDNSISNLESVAKKSPSKKVEKQEELMDSKNLNVQIIERVLHLLTRYITYTEENHTFPRTMPPHGSTFQGHPMIVYSCCEQLKKDFTLECHSNETLGSIRKRLAKALDTVPDRVQIFVNEKSLLDMKDKKVIQQLGFEDEQLMVIKISNYTSYPVQRTHDVNGNLIEETRQVGEQARAAFALEHEQILPSIQLIQDGKFYNKLLSLVKLGENRIVNKVLALLKLLPSDPSVFKALSLFYHETSEESVKSKSILNELFNCSTLSAFQILYNLEVLSAKLIPIDGIDVTALSFRQNFLKSGGLKLVIDVLQQDSIGVNVDYDIRQGCYSITFQIARYLLCNKASVANLTRQPSIIQTNLPRTATPPLEDTGNNGMTNINNDVNKLDIQDNVFSEVKEDKDIQNVEVPIELHDQQRNLMPLEQQNVPDSEQEETQLTQSQEQGDEVIDEVTITATQTIKDEDFEAMMACLIRVTWAAAAGKLQLAASKGSEDVLKVDTCLTETFVSSKDASLVQEGLELLVASIKLRPVLLETFYSMKKVKAFIIDVLVGSPNENIRSYMQENMFQLCNNFKDEDYSLPCITPRQFILNLLLKSTLPFWIPSVVNRSSKNFKQLERCYQYFDLLCHLINGLSCEEQQKLDIHSDEMLNNELDWLQNAVIQSYKIESQSVLAGHLMLLKTLFTCEGADKKKYGKQLISSLINEFLFSASRHILSYENNTAVQPINIDLKSITPKCTGIQCRSAAYDLLKVLADGCLSNFEEISLALIEMHHQSINTNNDWEYMPLVDSKSQTGYVGLKNAGATCYMNSVLQQLFLQPNIVEYVLEAKLTEDDKDNIMLPVQKVFAHLMESRLQYYTPELLWKTFKLWGENINVREQQDAFEFFSHLTDQLDEILKAKSISTIFSKTYGGVFLDQKICRRGCTHRYEREEEFAELQLGVKHKNLEESLAEFIKGDLLEGDNAYQCEKCGKKRDTLKRTCIKTPPQVLVIQLKRFSYDWEANRALKFDDYFEFPWELDIEPFTAPGLAWRERNQPFEENKPNLMEAFSNNDSQVSAPTQEPENTSAGNTDGGAGGVIESSEEVAVGGEVTSDVVAGPAAGPGPSETKKMKQDEEDVIDRDKELVKPDSILYELVGIVVHSGQANAGHYYSFVMDRKARKKGKKRWIKFNDNLVEDIYLNDEVLQNECFGGEFKAKLYETQVPYVNTAYGQETRLRYWNAYMLFYEKIDPTLPPIVEEQTAPVVPRTISGSYSLLRSRDSLVELTDLVEVNSQAKNTLKKLSPDILQEIAMENLYFMRNRGLYTTEYFHFIYQLATVNMKEAEGPEAEGFARVCMNLSINFLFNTYFRIRKKLRNDRDHWVQNINSMVTRNKHACLELISFLGKSDAKQYIKPYLLECPSKEVRSAFALILSNLLDNSLKLWGKETFEYLDNIIAMMVQMLEKDVVEHYKNCNQYLYIMHEYSKSTSGSDHLLKHNAFSQLMSFLLGPSSVGPSGQYNRRWAPQQLKEWHNLYGLLCNLTLICKTESQWNIQPEINRPDVSLHLCNLLDIPDDVVKSLYNEATDRFLKESLLTLRSLNETESFIVDCLCYTLCHAAWCCEQFSFKLINEILQALSTFMSNEIKYIFKLLIDLLLLPDPYQKQRVESVLCFGVNKSETETNPDSIGLFYIIQKNKDHDTRRSYLCIKFLVRISSKCAIAKELLKEHLTEWKWCGDWLKSKLKDNHGWSSCISAISNEISSTTTLQRTYSTQDTLEEINHLIYPSKQQIIANNTNINDNINNNNNNNINNNSTNTQRHAWPGVQENTRSNVPITEHGNGSNADMPPFIENHGIH